MVGFGPLFRHFDFNFTAHVLCRERVFGLQQLGGCSGKNNFAAVDARAEAEVDHIVGFADRLFVVFDNDDSIAEVAQFFERGEQAVVVALVQTDAGFIENVEHAGEARADLRREPDALRFAAGERPAFAVERQVVEPDIKHEAEARLNFLQNVAGDARFLLRCFQCLEKPLRLFDRERAELMNVLSADGAGERFGSQARAVTGGAALIAHVGAKPLLRPFTVGVGVAPLHAGDDSFERFVHFMAAHEVGDRFVRAVE